MTIEKDREQFTVNLRLVDGALEDAENHGVCEMSHFIERLKHSPRSVDSNNLFRDEGGRVFLHGIAGIGKTSFVEYLTLLWANRKIFHDFDFVFLIKCRDFNKWNGEITSEDSFFSEFLKDDVTELKKKIDGKRVLVIFDGLDELPSLESVLERSTNNLIDSIFYRLLYKQSSIFTGHKCIITGRPHIYSLLREHEARTIGKMTIYEIAGFDLPAIKLYVNNFMQGSSTTKDIFNVIKHNYSLRVLASVPQFLSSICCILATQEVTLSTSKRTELYVWVLVSFVREHFPDCKGMPYKIFKSERFQNFLAKITRVSYDLLMANSIVFNEGELSELLDTDDENEKRMVDSFIVKTETVTGCMYQFKHISLQEFLAAMYCYVHFVNIETLLDKKKYGLVEFVAGFTCAKKHRSRNRPCVMSLFVESLLGQYHYEGFQLVLPSAEGITRSLLSRMQERHITWRPVFSILHELFNNDDVLPEGINFDAEIYFTFHSLTTIECIHFVRFMHLLLRSFGKEALSKITVRVIGTEICGQTSQNLASLVKHVCKFRCSDCEIDGEFLKSILKGIQESDGNVNLVSMAFMKCNLTDEDLECLARCSVHLEEIECSHNDVSADFFSSVASNCECQERKNPGSLKLRKMRLNTCVLLEGTVRRLCDVIPYIETLDLSGCELTEKQVSEIADRILRSERENEGSRLKNLLLERCSLQDACIEKLSEVIPCLFSVDISRSATAFGQREIANDIVDTLIRKIEFARVNDYLRLQRLVLNSFSANEETKGKFKFLKRFGIDVVFRVWKQKYVSA